MRAITEDTRTNILKEQYIPDNLFIYVAKGGIRLYDGNKNYVFKAGEACIARKNRLAKYELLDTNETFEPVLFCFDEPFLKDFQKKHNYSKNNFKTADAFIRVKKNTLITSFIKSIKPYYKAVMELDADFEDLKYEELLIILLKNQPELTAILFDFVAPEKINLEAFMNKNFAFNVSIERFATLTGRSLSAFKRDFNKIFNDTPSKWLIKKRLQEAYILLSKQNQKPADIYLNLGFESLSHFSVAFKKQFNCTPTELTLNKRSFM